MLFSIVKKYLFLHFQNRTNLNNDNIQDIFDLAFFKPKSNDEFKKAVNLWFSDEEKAFNIYDQVHQRMIGR